MARVARDRRDCRIESCNRRVLMHGHMARVRFRRVAQGRCGTRGRPPRPESSICRGSAAPGGGGSRRGRFAPAALVMLAALHRAAEPMTLRPYRDRLPSIGQRVYLDPAAIVIGDVELADDVSIWPGCVLRGDVNFIRVGARTNVQDGTIVHVTHDGPFTRPGGYPTLIGADVTIGHAAVIHACTIEDAVLIGMNATVLDGAVVKKHGFVAAGAVIAPGKIVGERELWAGNPARLLRKLSDRDVEQLHYSALHYVKLKDEYLRCAPFAGAHHGAR